MEGGGGVRRAPVEAVAAPGIQFTHRRRPAMYGRKTVLLGSRARKWAVAMIDQSASHACLLATAPSKMIAQLSNLGDQLAATGAAGRCPEKIPR